MVDGEEVKRYPNIEISDSLKELEMLDFHFDVHMDGKITFEIHFEEGVLPEVFSEPRTRMTRAAKEKAAAQAATEIDKPEAAATEEPPAEEPAYKAAPSFAYAIGSYTVDKEGTLTGPVNPALIAALAEQGYTAAE